MKGGAAILDVLTNSIGALLILVVLFVKLIGDDATLRAVPLTATEVGMRPVPMVYLRLDFLVAPTRLLDVSIRGADDAGQTFFEWRPLESGPSGGMPAPALPVFTSYGAGQPVELWAQATPRATWSIEATPYSGEPSSDDHVDVTLYVTGAHLDYRSPPGGPVLRLAARWLPVEELERLSPATASEPHHLPVTTRMAADAVRVTLELPSTNPNPGSAE